jgi:hypothetical protein
MPTQYDNVESPATPRDAAAMFLRDLAPSERERAAAERAARDKAEAEANTAAALARGKAKLAATLAALPGTLADFSRPPAPACDSPRAASPAIHSDAPPAARPPKTKRAAAPAPSSPPPPDAERARKALTSNPRKLSYWRNAIWNACSLLQAANERARGSRKVEWLNVPPRVGDLLHDICDSTDAAAGALSWVMRRHGGSVALEVEGACLFREPGQTQRDDWSTPRARRKLALIVFLLMSPHELPRSAVTGSTSDESLLVTAGVPQTLLVALVRSAQREPYSTRTLQRDLAEIDACTDLVLRWRTPVAHAERWERRGNEHGVVNRYCVRAGMVREQWRRAKDAAEAGAKRVILSVANWMIWRPAPARGSAVPIAPAAPAPS